MGGRQSFNDARKIAFYSILADGRDGYAMASPLPHAGSNCLDDDADGKADSLDYGCANATDTSERSAS